MKREQLQLIWLCQIKVEISLELWDPICSDSWPNLEGALISTATKVKQFRFREQATPPSPLPNKPYGCCRRKAPWKKLKKKPSSKHWFMTSSPPRRKVPESDARECGKKQTHGRGSRVRRPDGWGRDTGQAGQALAHGLVVDGRGGDNLCRRHGGHLLQGLVPGRLVLQVCLWKGQPPHVIARATRHSAPTQLSASLEWNWIHPKPPLVNELSVFFCFFFSFFSPVRFILCKVFQI